MDLNKIACLRDEIKQMTVENCEGCNNEFNISLPRSYVLSHKLGCCIKSSEAITRYLQIAAKRLNIDLTRAEVQEIENMISKCWYMIN